MELVANQTKFTHKAKSSWGIGVFLRYEGSYIIIAFGDEGEKKFPIDSIGTMLKPVEEPSASNATKIETFQSKPESRLCQFDGESEAVGGKNVIASFESDDVLLLNESYTVVGSIFRARKIHAMYDLTVIGDLEVSECVVNGTLMVTGNVSAHSMNCANSCVIQGNADIGKIYVGGDFIADSAKCDEIVVDGNVLILTTIDINNTARINKTIVAYEGIMGAGSFTAQNAIANEYFEFDGDVSGKILELETDSIVSELVPPSVKGELSLSDLITEANKLIDEEYAKCPDFEESDIIEALSKIEAAATQGWIKGPDNERLFRKLVDISYKERIDTFEEYLYVLLAKKTLPEKIYNYETIDFVDSLLSDAEKDLDKLDFSPSNIEAFLRAVSIVHSCWDISGIGYDELYDKIFEAIGLKYNTVRAVFKRNITDVDPIKQDHIHPADISSGGTEKTDATIIPAANKELREDFLKKKMTHLAKKFGITDSKLERLASIGVRTCSDFISLKDETIENAYGRKAFLAKHLIEAKKKMAAKVEEML